MGLPVEVNNLMMGSLGGYTIGRSLRFRSSASAYLSRTPASSGNLTTWTWSGWIKRGQLGTQIVFSYLFYNSSGPINNQCQLQFNGSDQLQFSQTTQAGGVIGRLTTTAVYRDPSAWYHIVAVWNTGDATSSNRMKLYVNGVQVTAFGTATYPAQNTTSFWNTNALQTQGAQYDANGQLGFTAGFDGYLAEVNFIDGQALTPSSFGAYDTNGVWQPKKYSGTYGTNGFYLPFSNTSSTTTLVADASGNGNNWTPNNISLTAGTTYDSMIDSPTVSASASNYCVFNPVNVSGGGSTITDGNLSTSAGSTGTYGKILGSIGMSSGKWYWEVTITAVGSLALVGIGDGTPPNGSTGLGGAAGELAYFSNGNKYTNAVSTAYGATYTTNDVIGVAYDASAGTLTFYKNNSSQGAITGFSGTKYAAVGSGGGTNPQYAINFGQRPFTYTPPTGFNALNTYNLPAPSIANGAQYMAATTYTGNGTTQTITNGGNNTIGTTFQPDLVWIKSRSNALGHELFDVNRGVNQVIYSNATNAETNSGTMSAFNSNGFTPVYQAADLSTNNSGYTYVGWQWKAGGTGVTNNSGTITSTVSANPTAGFSIVTFTGNAVNGATVGHGLGVTPSMLFVKNRSISGSWIGWHTSISQAIQTSSTFKLTGYTGAIYLDLTNGSSTYGFDQQINGNGNSFVAYCFAAVDGYSAFGKYTGNGSTDGTFIYTGFRPRYLLVKNVSAAGDPWYIVDTSTSQYNVTYDLLQANSSAAELTGRSDFDILSNGFKNRATFTGSNSNGTTYIYAAFAENPFKYSRAR